MNDSRRDRDAREAREGLLERKRARDRRRRKQAEQSKDVVRRLAALGSKKGPNSDARRLVRLVDMETAGHLVLGLDLAG